MARVTVHLWSGLRHLTGGAEVVELEATTIGTMLDTLGDMYPGIRPILEAGVSVALNGALLTGARHQSLKADDEIFLLQRMKGG